MVSKGTQRKGDVAVTRAIASFTEVGWDVALPVSESARYDLIIDTGLELKRVQVKFTSTVEVDLRRIHSNSKGYAIKKYKSKNFDWLYVLKENGDEFLIREDLGGRSTIRPQPKHRLNEEGAAERSATRLEPEGT